MPNHYDNEIVLTPHYLETVFRSRQAPITMLTPEIISGDQRQRLLTDIAGRLFAALQAGIVEFPVIEIQEPSGTIMVPTQLTVAKFQRFSRTDLLRPELGEVTSHEARFNLVSPYQNLADSHIMLGTISLHSEDDDPYIEAIHLARGGGRLAAVDVSPVAPANTEAEQFAIHTRDYLLQL